MDKIEAHIALAGELNQVVVKSDLTWPEVILMKAIHGDAAVTDIEVVGIHELSAFDEAARLRAKYGRRYFEVWSKYDTNLPLTAPNFIPRWDDEVVIEHRRRRPVGLGNATVSQQQPEQGYGAQDQGNDHSEQPPVQVVQRPPPVQAKPKPKAKAPPPRFKPTPIIKAPAPAAAPATEV